MHFAAPVTPQMKMPFQPASTLYEPGFAARTEASPKLGNSVANVKFSSWSYNSMPALNASEENKGLISSIFLANFDYKFSLLHMDVLFHVA